MIGALPTSLTVDGKKYQIRTDYRVALTIFEAYNDPELSNVDKMLVCIDCLYIEKPDDVKEALEQASWFLDGGSTVKLKKVPYKIIDWEQDEGLIFPEVNKFAGHETRSATYIHWWTFLGYFNTIGEGLLSNVLNIREKRGKGKRLEKWEQEFFDSHKEMIIIKPKLTAAEQAELDEEEAFINELC